jgi:hypothetical protein
MTAVIQLTFCAWTAVSRLEPMSREGGRREERHTQPPNPWNFGGQILPMADQRSLDGNLALRLTCIFLAERVGFEPTVSFPTHDFQFAEERSSVIASVARVLLEPHSEPRPLCGRSQLSKDVGSHVGSHVFASDGLPTTGQANGREKGERPF